VPPFDVNEFAKTTFAPKMLPAEPVVVMLLADRLPVTFALPPTARSVPMLTLVT